MALFVGRLVPIKGLPRLLSALPDGMPLMVAGDGPERAALERSAPPTVRFLGEVRGTALADLYAAADLLVFPSAPLPDGRAEGAPVVLREALRAGLPIVTTRCGDAEALLAGTAAALLVDAEAIALRAALTRLRDDPGLRARMSRAARLQGAALGWEQIGPRLLGRWLEEPLGVRSALRGA